VAACSDAVYHRIARAARSPLIINDEISLSERGHFPFPLDPAGSPANDAAEGEIMAAGANTIRKRDPSVRRGSSGRPKPVLKGIKGRKEKRFTLIDPEKLKDPSTATSISRHRGSSATTTPWPASPGWPADRISLPTTSAAARKRDFAARDKSAERALQIQLLFCRD
jgi:hypothetical protein